MTPAEYVVALADHVRGAGGKITDRTEVEAVERHGTGLKVHCAGRTLGADAVVLASGALLSDLARPHGVRLPVHAGRGYSFTVDCDEPLQRPLYLPSARVAITPTAAGARVTGIMEFAGADDPPVAARFATIERGARPMLRGIDWASRANDWVGSRPLTADGIPLVGASRTKDVYVAGGHGMWGVTLGPLTGQLLAEQIVTGVMPPELRALDPTR
ncbi:FAD-binding oxidoreductase [Acidiferrimicrobium sp. IK]|uniref:NAD(P)/FAD-dependent oxidoreductase n=1 Tax=Acidiferrimicrobium sp. IK TaxID=2871700 RepID=UPI0021CB637C|nr:FAD-dependent oxidoreductase [Acidiferrimicrobium sp. IK]MCU4186601.1 FAD-binding oxidoreductase [Acidiferrimicrobium sp. IK]